MAIAVQLPQFHYTYCHYTVLLQSNWLTSAYLVTSVRTWELPAVPQLNLTPVQHSL